MEKRSSFRAKEEEGANNFICPSCMHIDLLFATEKEKLGSM